MAGESNVPVTAGAGTPIDTYLTGNSEHRQYMMLTDHGGYNGRFTSYRIPGRAGTTGQNLAALWNASASALRIDINMFAVDVSQTAAKVVIPPVIRTLKLTTIPTNGTAGWKVAEDSSKSSNANVSLFQDASADGTSSASALSFTQTLPTSGLSQEFAPRVLTLVGYESFDRAEFHKDRPITLNANEGIGMRLEYNTATSNPVTDMYVCTIRWEEYV